MVPASETICYGGYKVKEKEKHTEDKRSLTEQVEEWIQKEGYPLEFYTADVFARAGFEICQSLYVPDISEGSNKRREIDVCAMVEKAVNTPPVTITFAVECKWSNKKPWIVFSSRRNNLNPQTYITQSIGSFLGYSALCQLASDTDVQQLSTFRGCERSGFSMRQAFSGDFDICYSSLQSIVSGAAGLAKVYDEQGLLGKRVAIVFPVIVIDGALYETYYDQTKEAVVSQGITHTQVHWRGSNTKNGITTVDIVTKKHLEEFAKIRMSETKVLIDKLIASPGYPRMILERREPGAV